MAARRTRASSSTTRRRCGGRAGRRSAVRASPLRGVPAVRRRLARRACRRSPGSSGADPRSRRRARRGCRERDQARGVLSNRSVVFTNQRLASAAGLIAFLRPIAFWLLVVPCLVSGSVAPILRNRGKVSDLALVSAGGSRFRLKLPLQGLPRGCHFGSGQAALRRLG